MHPARLMLGVHGCSLTSLAKQAGLSIASTGRQLSGETRISEQVHAAMVELIGVDAAASVVAMIPERSERVAA